MDRMEASWVNDVMEEDEEAVRPSHEPTEEKDCGSKNEEEWNELLHSYYDRCMDEENDGYNSKEYEIVKSDEAEAAEMNGEEESGK